jgi:hypothetical protein
MPARSLRFVAVSTIFENDFLHDVDAVAAVNNPHPRRRRHRDRNRDHALSREQ